MTPQVSPWMMYLQIAHFLLTWGTALYVFWDRKRSTASKRLATIEARLKKLENPPADERWDKIDRRLLSIENELKHPKVCSNHERMENNDKVITGRLDDLHGDIKELSGCVKGLNRAVDLMNEHLINKKG